MCRPGVALDPLLSVIALRPAPWFLRSWWSSPCPSFFLRPSRRCAPLCCHRRGRSSTSLFSRNAPQVAALVTGRLLCCLWRSQVSADQPPPSPQLNVHSVWSCGVGALVIRYRRCSSLAVLLSPCSNTSTSPLRLCPLSLRYGSRLFFAAPQDFFHWSCCCFVRLACIAGWLCILASWFACRYPLVGLRDLPGSGLYAPALSARPGFYLRLVFSGRHLPTASHRVPVALPVAPARALSLCYNVFAYPGSCACHGVLLLLCCAVGGPSAIHCSCVDTCLAGWLCSCGIASRWFPAVASASLGAFLPPFLAPPGLGASLPAPVI